tara:strand:- start:1337 stop:2092 length:756 start_codon:yes stop_codon:yes gene_type:complete
MSTRKKSFGSLHCPKSLAKGIKKSSYGKKKRKKPKKKPVKKMKRRKKPVKKRRKKPVRRKPRKKKSFIKSMFKKYINPSKIQEVIQDNPELVMKAQELRNLKNSSNYSTRELVSIAALTTLAGLSVTQAENRFNQMRNSGMKTEDIFPALLEQYGDEPESESNYYQEQGYQPDPMNYYREEEPPVKQKKSFFNMFKRKFGKRKKRKKISASLKRLCKKHKVRLTVKRGKKRVYKSEKVLKKQCKNKMKKKK